MESATAATMESAATYSAAMKATARWCTTVVSAADSTVIAAVACATVVSAIAIATAVPAVSIAPTVSVAAVATAISIHATVSIAAPTVVPGTCSDEETAVEPLRTVITVRRAGVRRVVVIAPLTRGRYADSDANADLSFRFVGRRERQS
jgi:hypothetical protein